MNFHLQQPYLFSNLKIWFLENKARLPRTLDTEHFAVIDLSKCLEVSIYAIEEDIKRNGKPSALAKIYKDRLEIIYKALQDTENHNKPLDRI